jgi:tetratricopeptide (TPR) repeat protein
VSSGRRRALLYGTGLVAAAGLLFAGYGITVPPDPGSRLNGAAFLAGLGQTDQALAACDEVIKEHPDSHDAFVFRATFLAMAGRHDEALVAYDDAIARAKDDSVRCDLVLDRASVLLRAGRTKEFKGERDRLATMGAGYRLDVCEGLWAEKEGAFGAAVAAYGRVHEARPADEQVKSRLYTVLLELGREQLGAGLYAEARKALDRAVALLPRARDARLRAAEVCLATRDADGAIAHLREVGRKAPGVAPLVFRASTLLLEQRRREEALDALAAALQADPKGAFALLQNETIWRDELSRPDVKELLETEQPSTGAALTADGGVINEPRNSGEQGTVR